MGFKLEHHSFGDKRVGGKQYCTSCGLISLNNELTSWCTRQGCNYKDHPQYEAKIFEFTNLYKEK